MIDLSASLLAAEATPAFFSEVALILVASAGVAYVCHRLRIMPIVSFLIAGALIGPHALGLIEDQALIDAAAEIGVILLLFTIGIEFSLDKLGRIKKLIVLGGGLQVVLTVLLVTVILALAGVAWRTGMYTGFLVALSSTAIVMKVLMDRNETNSDGGQAALGILIFQDLAVIAMVLLVPMLAGGSGSGTSLMIAFAKAAGIIAIVLIVARRVMPPVLEAVARTCSQEIFLLTVIAICFGTAWLTSLAGVSLSLGAFLAGLVISESRFSQLAFGEILPLQILFSATFFVSVGLLLDVGFMISHPLLILVVILGVLPVKLIAGGLSLRLLGYASGTAGFTTLLMAQVGEFSFVLERTGREVGLYPAGLQNDGPQAFIAATVLLMIATPVLSRLGERFRTRSTAIPQEPAAIAASDENEQGGHIIIAGYGETGRKLARDLMDRGHRFLIVTLSPDGAREAESMNLPVLRGNYTRQHELDIAGARAARTLIVADDDLDTTRRVISSARALNAGLVIVARARFEANLEELLAAGATTVISDEREGVAQTIAAVLALADPTTADAANQPARVFELNDRQRASRRCRHGAASGRIVSNANGCAECVRAGDTWVHLRVCMTCGNVACCDSSKNRHATHHHAETGHPIIKSYEHGEDWAWCYEDRTTL